MYFYGYFTLILLGHYIFQFSLIERRFWQIVTYTCTCVHVLLANLVKILKFVSNPMNLYYSIIICITCPFA